MPEPGTLLAICLFFAFRFAWIFFLLSIFFCRFFIPCLFFLFSGCFRLCFRNLFCFFHFRLLFVRRFFCRSLNLFYRLLDLGHILLFFNRFSCGLFLSSNIFFSFVVTSTM